MKRILFLLLLAMSVLYQSCSVCYAQTGELPEPTTIDVKYAFEIGWGPAPVTTWTPIIPKSFIISDGIATKIHKYYCGKIGENGFESVAWNTTVEKPTKAIAVFTITSIPSGKFFDIFRIRSRLVVKHPDGTEDTTGFSEPSFWVLVIDFRKLGIQISIE